MHIRWLCVAVKGDLSRTCWRRVALEGVSYKCPVEDFTFNVLTLFCSIISVKDSNSSTDESVTDCKLISRLPEELLAEGVEASGC
jgi:hypothetical protein